MKKIMYKAVFIAALAFSSQIQAQGVFGTIKNVGNKAKDVKNEVDKTNRQVNSVTNDVKTISGNNTSPDANKSELGYKKPDPSSKRNDEPQYIFTSSMTKLENQTSFTESDMILFIFDYGTDLQKFMDKYLSPQENRFRYTLLVTTEDGKTLLEKKDFVNRFPVKETEPIIEFLQVGKENTSTNMVHLAYDFPYNVVHNLTPDKVYKIKFKFDLIDEEKNQPFITHEGVLEYNYRGKNKSVLIDHLGDSFKKNNTVAKNTKRYSSIHEENLDKVVFFKGHAPVSINNKSAIANTIDLKTPSSLVIYLSDAIAGKVADKTGSIQELFRYTNLRAKYFINGEEIITYGEIIPRIDNDPVKDETAFSIPLVPENNMLFNEFKFQVGAFAHVMSNVPAGVHTLKIEYYAGDMFLAQGEVKVNVNIAERDEFCRKYGRPKFSKGILEGQSALETQVKSLISKRGDSPIYVFANDSWTFNRDVWGNVLSREVLVYYIIKTKTGRCEMREFFIRQKYDGSKYYDPEGFDKMTNEPGFKYVVCQNY